MNTTAINYHLHEKSYSCTKDKSRTEDTKFWQEMPVSEDEWFSKLDALAAEMLSQEADYSDGGNSVYCLLSH